MRIMSYQRQIRTGKYCANEYATPEDFRRLFIEETDGLYQLAYLLTGDDDKAQQCFAVGLENSVKGNNVFREWAYSWAKRMIIRNTIRILRPQPPDVNPSAPTLVMPQKSKLRIIRDGHLEIDSVLALENFERIVFIMTVPERYSDPEAALLIGCSIGEIRAARICALQEVANLTCADPSGDIPIGCGPHHLPPTTNTPP